MFQTRDFNKGSVLPVLPISKHPILPLQHLLPDWNVAVDTHIRENVSHPCSLGVKECNEEERSLVNGSEVSKSREGTHLPKWMSSAHSIPPATPNCTLIWGPGRKASKSSDFLPSHWPGGHALHHGKPLMPQDGRYSLPERYHY